VAGVRCRGEQPLANNFLLRKAFENGNESGYILTVPRRGYKFIGKVSPQVPEFVRARRPWMWPAVAALVTIALASLAFVHFLETMPEARVIQAEIVPPEKPLFLPRLPGPIAGRTADGVRATGEDGRRQLWVRALDSGVAQLLDGSEGAELPFWSPDGQWVAFFAKWKLKKISAHGGAPITPADAPIPLGGSWSPTGTILFSPNFTALQQIPSAGGKATPAAAAAAIGGEQCCPWFLPDGNHYLLRPFLHQSPRLRRLLAG
jgi:hypothetical protein